MRITQRLPPAIAFLNPSLTTENVGDLFIAESVKRILDFDPDASFDVDPREPLSTADIDRINGADAAVILGTNLWHRRLPRRRCWTLGSEVLARIRVPIVPLGIGTSRRLRDEDDAFEPETIEILKRVHGSCSIASARDPRTAEALAQAGITNVAMTGCPTLFRSLEPEWKLRVRKPTRRVTVTTRAGQRRNARVVVRRLGELGLEPVVAAQKAGDHVSSLPLRLLGGGPPRLFRFDTAPYLALVGETLGAVGWRLHGNMLHLAEGNPAIFFANNSRAASFCEAFGLPCLASADGDEIPAPTITRHVEALLDPATFATFPTRYAAARAELVRVLGANGLPHRLGTSTGTGTAD